MPNVLIVDDEPTICWAIREALVDEGHTAKIAPSAEVALWLTAEDWRPDAVIIDVRLPGKDGLSAMRELRLQIGAVSIVVMTAFGNLETAVRAIEGGAFDYLVKPFDLDHAIDVLRRALASHPAPTVTAGDVLSEESGVLIGRSLPMQQVFKQIALAAANDVSVLVTGESGTGKELVARAIHRHSNRRDRPFLPVSIPALNPGVIESELFGHMRGAFTGAAEDRPGLFELVAGGTLLLDEIADVPLGLQVKLLRTIEQREIFPVGGTTARRLEGRIIAATNRPLTELVAKGAFREDLFFRLGVFQIHLPRLQDRLDDVPLLAEHFLAQIPPTAQNGPWRLTPRAVTALTTRDWPGNVRELRNAIEHAAIVARGGDILPEHFPLSAAIGGARSESTGERLHRDLKSWGASIAASLRHEADPQVYERLLQLVEPPLLAAVLDECEGNRAAAAQLLGLHRSTLRQKLRRHGLADASSGE